MVNMWRSRVTQVLETILTQLQREDAVIYRCQVANERGLLNTAWPSSTLK